MKSYISLCLLVVSLCWVLVACGQPHTPFTATYHKGIALPQRDQGFRQTIIATDHDREEFLAPLRQPTDFPLNRQPLIDRLEKTNLATDIGVVLNFWPSTDDEFKVVNVSVVQDEVHIETSITSILPFSCRFFSCMSGNMNSELVTFVTFPRGTTWPEHMTFVLINDKVIENTVSHTITESALPK